MMVFQELEIRVNTLQFWQQRIVDKVVLKAKTIANCAK
jgi:hypothetical protein